MSNHDNQDNTSNPSSNLSHIHNQAAQASAPEVQDNVVHMDYAHITDPYDRMILGFGGNGS